MWPTFVVSPYYSKKADKQWLSKMKLLNAKRSTYEIYIKAKGALSNLQAERYNSYFKI